MYKKEIPIVNIYMHYQKKLQSYPKKTKINQLAWHKPLSLLSV